MPVSLRFHRRRLFKRHRAANRQDQEPPQIEQSQLSVADPTSLS